MIESTLIRFFQFSWVLLAFSIIFPLYLSRMNIKSKTKLMRILFIVTIYAIFGIIMQENLEKGLKFTFTEFKIILSLASVVMAATILPLVLEQCEVVYHQNLSLRPEKSAEIIVDSLKRIRAKIINEDGISNLTTIIKAGYGNEYKVNIVNGKTQKIGITYYSTPYGLSLTRFRILFLVTAYPIIFSLGNNSFNVNIPIIYTSVDAEMLFFILYIVLILYIILLNSVQRNFFYQFEEIQKNTIMDRAQKLIEGARSRSINIGRPDLKSDIEAAKKRAEQIKDKNIKAELDERRKKAKKRIDGVLGRNESEEKGIDPDLIRKQLLIRKIKTILKSTPIAMEISLNDIAKKCDFDDVDQIEKIIIGLIDRNEVSGNYDIWQSIYVVGDSSAQFIEKTLSNLDLSVKDLEYIKLSKHGDIEIRLNNGDKNELSLKKSNKTEK